MLGKRMEKPFCVICGSKRLRNLRREIVAKIPRKIQGFTDIFQVFEFHYVCHRCRLGYYVPDGSYKPSYRYYNKNQIYDVLVDLGKL